jgi:hypothetical protein
VEDFRNDAIATKLLVDAASAATADRALVLQSRVRLPESLRATLEATGGRLVTVNDLRLDREDVYAVFEGRLSAADCAQVAESATGWPVAVLGLCNSTQPRNIAAGICGEDIQKILASEVLPFLPATVTNALTFLAMEVRGDDEELSIASGADDTADLLESLAAVPFVRHENIWELLSPLREIVVAQYGARGCATAARQVAFASHAARSARRRGHATDC